MPLLPINTEANTSPGWAEASVGAKQPESRNDRIRADFEKFPAKFPPPGKSVPPRPARRDRRRLMSDLPQAIDIFEEGPREGFQIEKGPITTADKIALIDALSLTGLKHIRVVSFVNQELVPGWADAEAVVAGFAERAGVDFAA